MPIGNARVTYRSWYCCSGFSCYEFSDVLSNFESFLSHFGDAGEIRRGGPGRLLQVVHRGRKLFPPRRIDAHDKLHGRLRAACARFGLRLPTSYETHVCAFVVVSRAAIRRRPREFYERLLAWHAELLG